MTTRALSLALAALLLAPLAHAQGVAKAPRPNIVLMMADDQGWGETGYNGHPHVQTPVLERCRARRCASTASTTDVATQYPEVVKRMTADLEAWQRSVERSLSGADY